MSFQETQAAIEKGKAELKQRIFPNETIDAFKESRQRREVYKGVFFLSQDERNNQSESEKTFRKNLLKIQSAYGSYRIAISNAKGIAYVFGITTLLVLFTSLIGLNENDQFAYLTLVEAVVLFVVGLSSKLAISFARFFTLFFALAIILEVVLMGLPDPFFFDSDNDVLANKRGAIPKIANAVSPLVYIAIKGMAAIVWLSIFLRLDKFKRLKEQFEH